jgi:2,4-dichlorophenol 6-monooxygenase
MTNFDCGVLVQMGPTWGRHSQEWILHFGFDLNDTQRFDEAALVPRLRELLKLPDLDLEVLYTSHWVLERVLANKYSEGRIFVAGDAAHRRPPTAGLGLNTAIEDAHNIAWKLALVVHQKADPSLLNTYEVERRAIGKRNADWGLFSFKHFDVLNAAVGLRPGDRKYNIQHFTKLFDGSPLGNTQLAQIRAVLALQEIEFTAHGLELGYRYESDAVVPDGSDPPPTDPRGQVYYPTTRPGHRLPHAWLEKNGKVLSTHDLIGSGETDFVLLTDEHGDGWVQQAYLASKSTRLEIGTARIASRKIRDDPDLYEDREDRWIGLREVKDGGAILVRPDNFVAWRSRTPPVAGEAALLDALSQILGKSKGRGIYSDEAHGEEEHDFKNDKGYGFSNSVQSVTL